MDVFKRKCINQTIEIRIFWVIDFKNRIRSFIRSQFWSQNPNFKLERAKLKKSNYKIEQIVEIAVSRFDVFSYRIRYFI